MSLPVMKGQKRLRLVMGAFLVCFLAVNGKLAILTTSKEPAAPPRGDVSLRLPRPAITDRNGEVLATDIPIASLAADPRKIIDVDEAVELLSATLPELNAAELREKLSTKPGQKPRHFVWIKRELTQRQRDAVHDLGLPGLEFRMETKRIYPKGKLAAHILGYVDVDNHGLAGIEKYLDDKGALFTASLAEPGAPATGPAQLSIDVRVQHALTDELIDAITKYKALAATGIVLDVHTGEVLAAASLPDYDPKDPKDAQKPENLNRFTGGAFELGSVVKTVSFAMALDSGTAQMDSKYDARFPLPIGRFKISDFHPQRRILTLPEVFTFSSNIGTVRMVDVLGAQAHYAFLEKLKLTERLQTEVPEAAAPVIPKNFPKATSWTASYGHGIAIEPLQLVQANAAFMNGGLMMPPTFLKRDPVAAQALAERVISEETSEKMRYLFRLNVIQGSGSKADVPGYRIGGKTGTADKVSPTGGYDKHARLSSFLAAFPMDAPRYLVLVVLDDPKATPESNGLATAGWNAAPTAGRVIARIAPVLGVAPLLNAQELEKIAADEKKLGAAHAQQANAETE